MRVLGISAHYHDSAAALIEDGRIVAAAQEERFSRAKHDASLPRQAIEFCLRRGGCSSSDLDAVCYYEKPLLRFDRILTTVLARAPRGFEIFRRVVPEWIGQKLWAAADLRSVLPGAAEYLFAPHHLSHAAGAFFPSPFDRAAVLTVDGVGEWATCCYGVAQDGQVQVLREIRFPDSLGLLYSAFTAYLGFRVNDGEYKVMGLAPYGEPRFTDAILKEVVTQLPDGAFVLNQDYFAFQERLAMTSQRFHAAFGGPPRRPEEPLSQRHMDVAASAQRALEILLLGLVGHVAEATGEPNLCLGGGVFLNAVANGRILRESPFERVWVQPAAGDAGAALGAAFLAHLALGGRLPEKADADLMQGALLGPEYGGEEIAAAIHEQGFSAERLEEGDLLRRTVEALTAGRVVGWFQGRMEFGPRALGARSILADPRIPHMQRRINLDVKRRESFRPFAPAILAERADEYFEVGSESPYMLLVGSVVSAHRLPVDVEPSGLERLAVPRSTIPAVTHVDGSARVQTVPRSPPTRFRRLLELFEERTGCPVLLNTSFNRKDEPIVCAPRDALNCYRESGLDSLAIGNFWLERG